MKTPGEESEGGQRITEKQLQVFGDSYPTSINDLSDDDDDDAMDIIKRYSAPDASLPQILKIGTPRRKLIPQNVRKAEVSSPGVGFSPVGYSPNIQTPSQVYCSKSGVAFRYRSNESTDWNSTHTSGNDFEVVLKTKNSSLRDNSSFKYMFQKSSQAALALNEFISRIGLEIIDNFGLEDPINLLESCTEDSVFIGRIRNFDGKLTSTTVSFEGTKEESDGHVITLDLSLLDEYHVYPGQVLAATGQNTLGKLLKVSKLHLPVQLPFSKTPIKVNSSSGPLNLLIAAGPFTPNDSMYYEPLKDLLKIIKSSQPQVCILIGPFLDSNHPMVDSGYLSKSFEVQFSELMKSMDDELSGVNTHLVFVSSFKDAHHDNVYPTPPYSFYRFQNCKASFASDPATISIGGVNIGVTSTDVLMHLGRNELSRSSMSLDRMGRLARYVLSQHNFYPLYPPDESVPFDVERWTDDAQMEVTPHILVIPSDLKHFIKNVDGTVVVNPERLTKGATGGSFARLKLDVPTKDSEICEGDSIADVIIGEIIKI